MKSVNKLLISGILFSLILVGNNAFGSTVTEKYPIIMVEPSELCQKTISNHVKTDCPTIDKLIKYDNSNQVISGKFVKQKDGSIIREKPIAINHYMYYLNSSKTIVCVSCEGNFLNPDLYQIIILEPHNFTFIDKYANVTKNTWESYSGRSMQGCNTATIAYSDSLLNDTINYLKSGCTKTSFNGTKTNLIPDQAWDYNNPFSSLHYQSAIKNILHGHNMFSGNKTKGGFGPGNCINGCDLTTSTRKAGY